MRLGLLRTTMCVVHPIYLDRNQLIAEVDQQIIDIAVTQAEIAATNYKVKQQSVGINSGGPIADQLITGPLVSGMNNSGQSSNTTHAAVSDGQILVRDTGNQNSSMPIRK